MMLLNLFQVNLEEFKKILSKEMEKASKELDYEKAAIARDRIKALTQIQTSQKINQTNLNEADVISIIKKQEKLVFKYFFLDLNKIGVIKLFILNMIQMIQ
jgi:excinuclease UvrABC nuclease subunit